MRKVVSQPRPGYPAYYCGKSAPAALYSILEGGIYYSYMHSSVMYPPFAAKQIPAKNLCTKCLMTLKLYLLPAWLT